jgi:hypothetical protein
MARFAKTPYLDQIPQTVEQIEQSQRHMSAVIESKNLRNAIQKQNLRGIIRVTEVHSV